MDARQNGRTAAHPIDVRWFDQDNDQYSTRLEGGLTKREAIAMQAPEVDPKWSWQDPIDAAAIDEARIKIDALLPPTNAEDNSIRNELLNWYRDGSYDLTSDDEKTQAIMNQYRDAAYEYKNALNTRKDNAYLKRRAAWAVAWADALLAELAKEASR